MPLLAVPAQGGAEGGAALMLFGFHIALEVLHKAAAAAQPTVQGLDTPAAHEHPLVLGGVEDIAGNLAEIGAVLVLHHQGLDHVAFLPVERAHGVAAGAFATEAAGGHVLALLHQFGAFFLGGGVGVVAGVLGIPDGEDSHAHGLAALFADQHHVGSVDGGFLLHDAAGLHRIAGLLVTGHHVHALNDDLAGLGERSGDLALRALILAGDNHHQIILTNVHLFRLLLQNFGSQGDDLHEVLLTQLAGNGSKDTGALGHLGIVDDNGGVIVETDVAAIKLTYEGIDITALKQKVDEINELAGSIHVAAGKIEILAALLDENDQLIINPASIIAAIVDKDGKLTSEIVVSADQVILQGDVTLTDGLTAMNGEITNLTSSTADIRTRLTAAEAAIGEGEGNEEFEKMKQDLEDLSLVVNGKAAIEDLNALSATVGNKTDKSDFQGLVDDLDSLALTVNGKAAIADLNAL